MAEKRDITRLEKPIRAFARREPEWQVVESPDTMAAICHALEDQTRATIFKLLGREPIRQIDLVGLLNEATGQKYSIATITHHLGVLEKVGLIAYEELQGGQVKMVYRTTDVEVRTRTRPKPEIDYTHPSKITELFAKSRQGPRP